MTIKEARHIAHAQLKDAWIERTSDVGRTLRGKLRYKKTLRLKNRARSKRSAYTDTSSDLQRTLKEPSFFLDIDVFLQKILNVERAFLLAHNDTVIDKKDVKRFFSMVEKRKRGLPVAYIVGEKEFFNLPFFVTSDVLIPKPDTELVVEHGLQKATEKIASGARSLRVLDLCTGSGCIGLAFAKHLIDSLNKTVKLKNIKNTHSLPELTLVLSDISTPALKVAQKNAERIFPKTCIQTPWGRFCLLRNQSQQHYQNQNQQSSYTRLDISTRRSHLFQNIEGEFDLILTNPPYVSTRDTNDLLNDGRNEPRIALDGGDDGLDFIRLIVERAQFYLKKDGYLIMEIGETQAAEVVEMLKEMHYKSVDIVKDLAGKDRVIVAQV